MSPPPMAKPMGQTGVNFLPNDIMRGDAMAQ